MQDPHPGTTSCPRCYSQSIHFKKRGFHWGLALLGLFLLPPFGILFGLIGRNDLRYTCCACGNRWKH
jgi:tellurium resistance protein TerD